MRTFDEKTEALLTDLLDKSSEAYDSGNVKKAFDCLVKAYQSIPEPKKEYNEAYNYCSYALDFILEEKYNIEESKSWLEELHSIAEYQKTWDGSIDFFAGKTNFRLGNFTEAKINFDNAVKIGKGFRYFEEEDKIYQDFYLHPEKYMKEEQ